ncbi:hypothetical protein MKW98_019035 [Papaver atlanticum]|uniref:J domain-containing protein n=1 Tax=Papaver atlanticum TaxID=357466 RepID=A0AAD4XY03_9MAGN|nr:hypothetical protein MKW98_019035 [Papaver atlanticum]
MMEIDHYAVLGLPSGEEGAKLTQADIKKAYKTKARELHPDKCPVDPNANANFQSVQSSYNILRDEIQRKRFDDLLSSRAQVGSKLADFHDKVRAYFCPPNPDRQAREEEERCRKQFRVGLAKLFRMLINIKRGSSAPDSVRISSAPASDNLAREEEVDALVELAVLGIEIITVICKIIPIVIASGKRYYQAASSFYSETASSFYSAKGLDMFFRFRERVRQVY